MKVLWAKIVLRFWIMGFKAEKYYWLKMFPGQLIFAAKALIKARRFFKNKIWNQFSAEYGYTKRDLEI